MRFSSAPVLATLPVRDASQKLDQADCQPLNLFRAPAFVTFAAFWYSCFRCPFFVRCSQIAQIRLSIINRSGMLLAVLFLFTVTVFRCVFVVVAFFP